ncbi:MAG: helix-turn-helix domain-containing protein [Lachnospiraceae bacterium]|nr:helix-turn-helix domain-containing protein [Lachnospiraceae bacterium]
MTWEEYKNEIKSKDAEAKSILEEAEAKSAVITAMISRRNDLGLSQRDLAELCGIPQSSVARIESNKTIPKLDMIIKIFTRLGLGLSIVPLNGEYPIKKSI